jgi:hypothetical protein
MDPTDPDPQQWLQLFQDMKLSCFRRIKQYKKNETVFRIGIRCCLLLIGIQALYRNALTKQKSLQKPPINN